MYLRSRRHQCPVSVHCSLRVLDSSSGVQRTLFMVSWGEGAGRGIRRAKLPNPLLDRLENLFGNWLLFESILGANMAPSWFRKSIKIDQISMPRCLSMLRSLFHRCLIHVCSNFGPPKSQNILKSDWKNLFVFGVRPFHLNLTTMRFGCSNGTYKFPG